jgi:hypothetical protein
MSYFAEIDQNNIVTRILVGNENYSNQGYDWFIQNLGGTWIQTSYNGNIRKHFASVGFSYDAELDAFIPPKPYGSWELNRETCTWTAPTPYPTDGKNYRWDEPTISWVEIPQENTGA